MIDVGTGPWPYRGVTSEVTAVMTVVREIPNGDAILSFGTPSAECFLINAQFPNVITLQSLSVHFSNA